MCQHKPELHIWREGYHITCAKCGVGSPLCDSEEGAWAEWHDLYESYLPFGPDHGIIKA